MGGLEWSVEGSGAAKDPPRGLARRVWDRDPTAWAPGEDDPAERLGWLDLPTTMPPGLGDLGSFADDVSAGTDHVVLLGMGGSSLAPEMFSQVYGVGGGGGSHPQLEVLDSTHPAQIAAVTGRIEPARTLFVVSSKSGGTIETMSLYKYFRRLAGPDRFVAVTDPGTSLDHLAQTEGFRALFTNPPDIGGRYSALSLFGLVPAALIGVDLRALCASAAEGAAACRTDDATNPGKSVV